MSEPASVLDVFDAEMQGTGTEESTSASTAEDTTPELVETTPDPVEAPEPEAPATDGVPRDAHGRFAPKAAGDAPDVPEGVPEAQPPAPFQYRSMNETRAWDGVTVDPQGNVLVPADKVGDLRAALNAKHLADGEYVPLIDRYKQEVHELRQRAEQRTLEQARYETMSTQLSGMLMERDLETALVKFMEMHEQFPALMSRAEVEYWKSQAASQGQRAETPQTPQPPATYPMPAPEAALGVTLDMLEHLKLDAQYKDLGPDDWKQLEASHRRTPLAFLRPATAEESAQYGGQIAVGQPVFDEAAYQQYVTEWAAMKRHGARVASKATEAARFNASVAKATPAKASALAVSPSPAVPESLSGPQKMQQFFRRDFLADADD